MAEQFIQLPVNSTGTKMRTFEQTVGANVVDHQAVVLCDSSGNIIGSATGVLAGTEQAVVTRSIIQGASQTAISGSITTATSVVGGATDWSHANLITVAAYGAAHAGVSIVFEASIDATNWFALQGCREDSGITENASGVLVANSVRAWTFALAGWTYFRVRAVAWTSGTLSVTIAASTLPDPPTVSAVIQSPPRTSLVLATATAGVTPAATEALATLAQCQRGFSALGSATSFALTAGKTFVVQSMSLGVRASTTTAVTVTAVLRFNPTGAVTATSPVIGTLTTSSPAAVAATGQGVTISWADGKYLPAGTTPGQVGVSLLGSTATGTAVVSVEGHEI